MVSNAYGHRKMGTCRKSYSICFFHSIFLFLYTETKKLFQQVSEKIEPARKWTSLWLRGRLQHALREHLTLQCIIIENAITEMKCVYFLTDSKRCRSKVWISYITIWMAVSRNNSIGWLLGTILWHDRYDKVNVKILRNVIKQLQQLLL